MGDTTQVVPRWALSVLALFTSAVCMAAGLTPDGSALIEFKNALTVMSPLLESWNASDASPCSWGGVICTDSGRVRNITLVAQEPALEGNISSSLGKLEFLEGLGLEQNKLSGSIPPELGNLSSLRMLSLSSNALSGEIPPELGSCRSLANISVAFNSLSGNIPEVIYKKLNLTYYDVSNNNFSGDITTALDDLSKMPTIESINMNNNSFTGTLPPSIGNATFLNYLNLDLGVYGPVAEVSLGRIPKELGKLVHMKLLGLGGNFTGEIPPELQNIPSLENLLLENSSLEGEIPPWIGNWTSLKFLYLRSSQFNGSIPPTLGNLVNLTVLDIEINSLTGPIPQSFAYLKNLKTLALNGNSLTGQIPPDLSRMLTSLEWLGLFSNNMSGSIPHDFGKFMPNLIRFMVTNNFFNGTLPDGLCNGGKLLWLTTGNNSFEGAIPTSLASCPSLVVVNFQDNQFTSIPDGFGRNSSVQTLRAARNRFTGRLPLGLGANSQLAYLDVSENSYTGDISQLEFSQLAQNLSVLMLAKNNFTGEIPAAMALCKLLYVVDLSYNSLTGTVPLALGNLSSLEELQLQGNKLTVLHPSIYNMGFAATLRLLNLAENPWNTSIATEIGSLAILQTLNLSHGGYTGPIPSSLAQLSQLEVLDLSHNDLTGEVPSVLGELMTSLTSVNISFNRLTGSLPPAWVKFLNADPASFRGNPGLCVHYDANNVCTEIQSRLPVRADQRKGQLSVRAIVGAALGAVALAGLLAYVAFRLWRRRLMQTKRDAEDEVSEMNMTNEAWSLTFDDILSATENLSDKFIVGRGAHGVVYKVKGITETYPCMAVKKIVFTDSKLSTVPHKCFWAEVKTVGKARHRNLVTLLGFIKRDNVGLLLYDYVHRGNLHAALHSTEQGIALRLTWEARLRIAKGVAHGLAYLHHDHDVPIVHRDIKSCNVLLDDDLEPHISDFGLAKVLGMQQGPKPWLSTQNVMGTFGYIPPEAGFRLAATPQLDVYSYGVLLLELLTGKEPTHDPTYGEDFHVVAWVKEAVELEGGRMSKSVLDPTMLNPKYSPTTDIHVDEMLRVGEIALLCTQSNPADRPTMRDVENVFNILFKCADKRNAVRDQKGDGVKTPKERCHDESSDESSDASLSSDPATNYDGSEGRESCWSGERAGDVL
ncbi:hypothetical protein KC19_12G040900 [Ceratodon purpureus]|uniref:non-specific serine/threonine protein kinase n=1 Tax=Ceratodon purpureus TaxID=3225 RepID=A0A8T0G423_CERPU|nr:hypothetical protein KC19_12G040900 [Ceratodon purpureus]